MSLLLYPADYILHVRVCNCVLADYNHHTLISVTCKHAFSVTISIHSVFFHVSRVITIIIIDTIIIKVTFDNYSMLFTQMSIDWITVNYHTTDHYFYLY